MKGRCLLLDPPASLQVELVHLLADVVVDHIVRAPDEPLVGAGLSAGIGHLLPEAGKGSKVRGLKRFHSLGGEGSDLSLSSDEIYQGAYIQGSIIKHVRCMTREAYWLCPLLIAGRSKMASRTVTALRGAPTWRKGKT